MGKKKQCNAIVQSVYMGSGTRMYYEKLDVITYTGQEITNHSLLTDMYIAWQTVRKAVTQKVEEFKRETPDWPPHNLLCDCPKCMKSIRSYTKAIKER